MSMNDIIDRYNKIVDIVNNYENNKDTSIETLAKIMDIIFNKRSP